MSIEIRDLQPTDRARAVRFAIEGMHLYWYLERGPLLTLYGWLFWCAEEMRATQVLAAYHGDGFVGVLLADMEGEARRRRPLRMRLLGGLFSLLERLNAGEEAYDRANREMLDAYRRGLGSGASPDGEIVFLAADPDSKIRGIGTALLTELARREPGKRVFLYTDSGCTWQFYEVRGFTRQQERHVEVVAGRRRVPLDCYLYDRVL